MDIVGTIEDALRQADAMLARAPQRAVLQAEAILDVAKGHPQALLILGAAHARMGDAASAEAILAPLVQAQPHAAAVHREWGMLLTTLGRPDDAIAALRHATSLMPADPQAWRALGDLLILQDRGPEADAAYAAQLRASVHDPELMRAAVALCDDDIAYAEHALRDRLKRTPTDVAAIRMLAEVATRLGRYGAAENLLQRCLELAPSFAGARHNLAVVLYRQHRAPDAVPHIERLLADEPNELNYINLLAAVLAGIGDYDRAAALYATLVARYPRLPRLWLGYGHAERTAGRRDSAITAYRRTLELAPTMGEAWWSLANLKLAVLDDADTGSMRRALATPGISVEDRFHLLYAIGLACEERHDYAASFAAYAEGAKLRRGEISYDADTTTRQVADTCAVLTPAFLARRTLGCADPAPIFVIGLPRAGSTLIEQMLASHPLVEGTMELPEIANLARRIDTGGSYPACLAEIPPQDWAGWGRDYLERSRIYRKTDRPYFIDKMPNNWLHAGLIHLALPNAKIIDARRGAMATCFSAFKQHFARGQNYSYDQTELGRFYTDYLALMAHLDGVLPGRIHRVRYETMVDDTEAELRRLLTYCGLAFDPACLRFHENARAVRTASSEQVRRPIFRQGLNQWHNYAPWLGELRAALGPAAEARQPD